jgi:transposase
MELSVEQAAELRELANSRDVSADVAMRAWIVLWSGEGRRRMDIAELLGVSLPTVDRWKARYAQHGLAGLEGNRPGGAREQVPARVRARVIALSLYLSPPGGAVVLSIDEKTQVQALDRTQPVLPVTFAATEKRTHDYVRHGTTDLFAALNVGTGEVVGECKPSRNGKNFLAFLKKAVKPHAGKEIHVVLDNLSTHTTPEVKAWLASNPHIHFHFTPVGSSWINQIETWFGILTRQSIRRGTFSSVTVLIKQIRDYIDTWNSEAKPFTWTATAEEILAKVRLVQTNVKKLVANNSK